jgi:hypothetical protein
MQNCTPDPHLRFESCRPYLVFSNSVAYFLIAIATHIGEGSTAMAGDRRSPCFSYFRLRHQLLFISNRQPRLAQPIKPICERIS